MNSSVSIHMLEYCNTQMYTVHTVTQCTVYKDCYCGNIVQYNTNSLSQVQTLSISHLEDNYIIVFFKLAGYQSPHCETKIALINVLYMYFSVLSIK